MKKTNSENWLMNSPVSIKKGAAICLIVYVSLIFSYLSGGKEFIYNRIVHPLEFQLRNRIVGFSPLDPRIKIFAVDQKTMNDVELESVPIKDWTLLLNALAKAQPRAVFLDKAFLLPLSKNQKEIAELSEALSLFKQITAGATYTPTPIQGLIELNTDETFNSQTEWLKISPGFIYGPRPELVKSFSSVGHTNYEDNGYIKPFIRTAKDRVIPFWSLLVGTIKIQNNIIFVDDEMVPIDEENRILVNLASPASYWKNTFSLVNVLKKARNNENLYEISSDDIVVILTGMYAGTASMKSTPAGTMPGGFILAEVINSALKRTWLKYIHHELLFLGLFCLFGLLTAYLFGPRKFWIALISFEIALVSFGLISFIYFGLMLPWAFPALGFFLTSVMLFAEKSRIAEMKSKALQFSLQGMIEPEKLKQIMLSPEKFRLEPRNQILTVMFIDIVGFSILAERESPAEVFKRLRDLLGLASDIVHRSGGIIDRSLGDGLLCFFGYQYELNAIINTTHAEQAMKCAAEIQGEILKRDFLAMSSGGTIFPLRIGVNTGEVYAGDLGRGHKIDFTVIGHSVNFAQRLESACENYRVMCGPGTHDSLELNSSLKRNLTRKYITIKHHAELVEAYEFDPFFHNAEAQANQKLLCRKLDKSSRIDVRWSVDPTVEIKIVGTFGEGHVINFSQSGLEIKSKTYIGKGAHFNFVFSTQNKKLENLLKAGGVIELTAEVRWSWNDDGAFRLGLKFKNLSHELQATLLQSMRTFQA